MDIAKTDAKETNISCYNCLWMRGGIKVNWNSKAHQGKGLFKFRGTVFRCVKDYFVNPDNGSERTFDFFRYINNETDPEEVFKIWAEAGDCLNFHSMDDD